MTELLPCPFCGGEAETHEVVFPYHYWDVWCDGECFDHFCEKPTEAEAIAAWNSRAERTCKQVLTDCNDGLMPPFTAHCSACDAEWGFTPNYCPNCGAKVVDE